MRSVFGLHLQHMIKLYKLADACWVLQICARPHQSGSQARQVSGREL
jgi:hypothetical protein